MTTSSFLHEHLQMYAQFFSSHLSQRIIFILLFFFILPKYNSQSQNDEEQSYYSKCLQPFNCGEHLRGIGYPFWGENRPSYCGLEGFKLSCEDNNTATIDTGNQTFRVVDINNSTFEIRMERQDLGDNICPLVFSDKILNETLFVPTPTTEYVHLFYGCPHDDVSTLPPNPIRNNFTCMRDRVENVTGFFVDKTSTDFKPFQGCKYGMIVPVNSTTFVDFKRNISMGLDELLESSFLVEYEMNKRACIDCESSHGLCWKGTELEQPSSCRKSGAFKSSICNFLFV